jgi:hypothetical protein
MKSILSHKQWISKQITSTMYVQDNTVKISSLIFIPSENSLAPPPRKQVHTIQGKGLPTTCHADIQEGGQIYQYSFLTWAANATPRLLYPCETVRYSKYRRPVGPQGRYVQVWRRENILPPPGFKPWIVQREASRYIDCSTPVTPSPK